MYPAFWKCGDGPSAADVVNTMEARDLARYIRRRLVACEPDGKGHRCLVEGQDLARLILFNGGARAAPDASAELREAEDQAREAGVGLWRR